MYKKFKKIKKKFNVINKKSKIITILKKNLKN